jgi:hypothetical protein
MTPKVALDNILRRLGQWSTHSKGKSHSSRAYRTEFQRFLWGAIFLSSYFFLVFMRLSGDESGSTDNGGIWAVILFGIFFTFLGAYFAPGWSGLASNYTASGRRRAAERAARIRGNHHLEEKRPRNVAHSSHKPPLAQGGDGQVQGALKKEPPHSSGQGPKEGSVRKHDLNNDL